MFFLDPTLLAKGPPPPSSQQLVEEQGSETDADVESAKQPAKPTSPTSPTSPLPSPSADADESDFVSETQPKPKRMPGTLSPSAIFGNLSEGQIEPDPEVPPPRKRQATATSTRKIPKKQPKEVEKVTESRKGKAPPKKTDPKEVLARGEPPSLKDSSPEPEGI